MKKSEKAMQDNTKEELMKVLIRSTCPSKFGMGCTCIDKKIAKSVGARR